MVRMQATLGKLGTEVSAQPAHPTLSAFVRASTLSLGSIAFGSLIVTLLELIRLLLNVARNNANADGHRKLNTCADVDREHSYTVS